MNDRRRRARLSWMSMEARVKVKKGLFSSEWLDVQVVDYSTLGIGFETKTQFDAGDPIILTLRLASEVGDLGVDQIKGVVRHRKPTETLNWAYGVEFELDSARKQTLDALERIESVLERMQRVADRIR